jgi:hypothetical protein
MSRDDHAKRMAEFQREFEVGKKEALLYALAECVGSSPELPIPNWVTEMFEIALWNATTGRIASWDDVFGKPLPKGKQLAAKRRRLELREKVWKNCWSRIERGAAIEPALFEAVAGELHIGTRQVRELFYELKRAGRRRPQTADEVGKIVRSIAPLTPKN